MLIESLLFLELVLFLKPLTTPLVSNINSIELANNYYISSNEARYSTSFLAIRHIKEEEGGDTYTIETGSYVLPLIYTNVNRDSIRWNRMNGNVVSIDRGDRTHSVRFDEMNLITRDSDGAILFER